MSSITNIISFPGLGIGEFKVNNVAFSVFGLDIAWYGIIITAGMIAAFLYASWRAVKFEGQKFDDMLDYAIFCIIFGVIGARAYYIIMDDSHYTLKQMFALRDGGLAIYGGIIAGALTAFAVTKIKKLKFSKIVDAIAPGVILAQAIGRWGNFMNGEAYGGLTDLPWRMGFTLPYGTIYVHPTFLYESLWNLLGFVLINLYYKKKKFNGEVALMCMTWYGLGRMFIEGLRTDSLYIGSIRVSQLVAFLSFVSGLIIIISLRSYVKKHSDSRLSIATKASNTSATKTDISYGGDSLSENLKADITEDGIGDVCENSKASETEYKENDSKDGKDVCDNE